MTLQILTDSACDLPADLIEECGIEVIPLIVQLDGKEHVDGKDISPSEVYDALRAGKVPRTSQTPVQFFREVFSRHVRAGRSCLYIAFSSKLSGTCQTGMMVAEQMKAEHPGAEIDVVDTLCGSMGQGLLVLEAAKMARDGVNKTQIVSKISALAEHMEHIFTVDDLEHLHRGGRVSRATAFIGGILNVKPLLHVKRGLMIPIEKVRGKNKAIKRLVEIVEERGTSPGCTIGISHADDLDAAMKLKNLIEKKLGYKDIIINVVGSVLGCHIGLGGVAVFFLNGSLKAAHSN